MPIDEETKSKFLERAQRWMEETHSKFCNWTLGKVSGVKGAFYNKEERHSEALPDGLVVPILCAKCGNTIAHYSRSC